MNKNELDFEKTKIQASKFKEGLVFFSLVVKLTAFVLTIYIIMDGLRYIVSANPDAINALAEVVKNLQLSKILGYILAMGCATGWALERKGKKRLLPAKAAARHALEQNDPYHPPSGLTPAGDTPKTEET